MKILVTGGAGFMGSDFIRFLLQNNLVEKLINYDSLTYAGNLANLKEIEDDERYVFVKGNINDGGLLEKTIEEYGIDTIVSYAAETHVDRSISDPDVFLRTNVLGTSTLLNVANKFDLRYHQVSTDEVFGHLEPNDPKFNEKTPYNPRSPYSASKAGSDMLTKSYFTTYGTKVTISNSSNNYGPFQFPEKLIPLFITNLMQDKKIPVYGDGLNVRDWIYVRDHSKAVWEIVNNGEYGESYCVGGNSEKNNMEVTNTLLKAFDKDESSIDFVEDRKGHDRRYAIDFSKMTGELGWKPEMTFAEGIKKTIEWYKDNESWWKEK